VGNRLLLSNGGTQSIESPSEYSEAAKSVLQDLGIETKKFYKAYDQKLYSHLGTACFFDKETFGEDRVVPGMGSLPWPKFLDKAPLPEKVRREIARLYTEKKDYLPGLSRQQKQARLARISYAGFLTDICHADPAVLPFFHTYTYDLFAVGIETISALACYRNPDDYGAYHYAGFDGMDLGETAEDEGEPYIFHFPDGNASVARLLVRSLVPACIPGHKWRTSPPGLTTAKLDQPSSPIRIRPNATAARVRHLVARCGERVEVAYVREGNCRARGQGLRAGLLHGMVPYLCTDCRAEGALHGVKEPFITPTLRFATAAFASWASAGLFARRYTFHYGFPSVWCTNSTAILRNRWCCSCCAFPASPRRGTSTAWEDSS
jgi:spermidine dehydrogenase